MISTAAMCNLERYNCYNQAIGLCWLWISQPKWLCRLQIDWCAKKDNLKDKRYKDTKPTSKLQPLIDWSKAATLPFAVVISIFYSLKSRVEARKKIHNSNYELPLNFLPYIFLTLVTEARSPVKLSAAHPKSSFLKQNCDNASSFTHTCIAWFC